MSLHSSIGWCDDTVNESMGCDGCELWEPERGVFYCYAGTNTERKADLPGWPPAFDHPTIFPGRIATAARWKDLTGTKRPAKPWLDGLPRIIFVGSEGDTFTEGLPEDWLAPRLPIMAATPHQWLLLTKRTPTLAAFAARHPLPPNVWAGTSILDRSTLGRVKPLLDIACPVRFLSLEPLWGPIDLAPVLATDRIGWVIVGGHSGTGHRAHVMDLAWVSAIADTCTAFGVPLFVKQDSGPKDGKPGRLPADLWARKEMPRLPAARPSPPGGPGAHTHRSHEAE